MLLPISIYRFLLPKHSNYNLFALLQKYIPLIFLAMALACDNSTLPVNVKIQQRGPVLKISCSPGLRAFEAIDNRRVQPARNRFARYVCINGTSFQQIGANGFENTSFFCADSRGKHCPPLQFHRSLGLLKMNKSVAVWGPKVGNFSILYCTFGIWRQLGDSKLPSGVRVGRTGSSATSAPDTNKTPHVSRAVQTKHPSNPAISKSHPGLHISSTLPANSRLTTTPSAPIRTEARPSRTESGSTRPPYFPVEAEYPVFSLPDNAFDDTSIVTSDLAALANDISSALHQRLLQSILTASVTLVAVTCGGLLCAFGFYYLLKRRKAAIKHRVEKAKERLDRIIAVP
nr:unnamed protein product [Spirometra erinaceieuropaei]